MYTHPCCAHVLCCVAGLVVVFVVETVSFVVVETNLVVVVATQTG